MTVDLENSECAKQSGEGHYATQNPRSVEAQQSYSSALSDQDRAVQPESYGNQF